MNTYAFQQLQLQLHAFIKLVVDFIVKLIFIEHFLVEFVFLKLLVLLKFEQQPATRRHFSSRGPGDDTASGADQPERHGNCRPKADGV